MNRLPQGRIPESDMDPRTDDPVHGQPPVPHDADDQALDVERDVDDLLRE